MMSAHGILTLSMIIMALAMMTAAGVLLASEWRRARHGDLIRRAIHRTAAAMAVPAGVDAPAVAEVAETPAGPVLPLHWLGTGWGRALVGDEDRVLIEQCGYSSQRAQWMFLVGRILLAALLPLLAWCYWEFFHSQIRLPVLLSGGFLLGFTAPKWLLRSRATKRRACVTRELPLFVDLLRLLQGVGMSLDQSLLVMATEFNHVLPVLGRELELSNRQYTQGRSREHSLQRLATTFENDNLAGLVQLLIQVDRHGGAVQEPLRAFSERMRELRRSEMKTRIGKITVKMTVVMVLTLLPALLTVAAGPGFLAVFRSLGDFGR